MNDHRPVQFSRENFMFFPVERGESIFKAYRLRSGAIRRPSDSDKENTAMTEFKLTYATMFDPPEELHARFDQALQAVRSGCGKEHGLIIDGRDVFVDEKLEDRCPADTRVILALGQSAGEKEAHAALAAARRAFDAWSHTSWKERVRLLRRTADLIDQRLFEMGAVLSLEVGKVRMEALGDIAETADLIRYACSQMEKNDGFLVPMERDPLVGFTSQNTSVMRPYGVWVVISPFNFPFALSGGPAGAALAAGNTVVIKPASDTPWSARLLCECFRDAGLPEGTVNLVTGPGRTLGKALIDSREVDGITFTGSYEIGMKIFRDFGRKGWIRPTVIEMGGKNATIVSRHADIERVATGIVRSAFGMQGQKCSACSRVYVESPLYQPLLDRLVERTLKLIIGDPTKRDVYLGPVINKTAYERYKTICEELSRVGRFLTGGRVVNEGSLSAGYFCMPTVAVDVPLSHPLWRQELFLPITMVTSVISLDEAMDLANDSDYGLTAGFYGSEEEVQWFFDKVEAGVAYANRPQGATTGAWPGFQPFGGWKGSGSTGKNAGGHYYLQLYMHEQVQTLVR
jgi:1-pyrroline-5-carboxylate dehydrogenase